MNYLPWIILAALVIFILMKEQQGKRDINAEENEKATTTSFSDAYQKKYLLTKNEWYEYKKLKQYAKGMDLQVCPKVRLLDIIEPRKGENYRSLMARIQSKHVDFVICDQDLRIKAILELDDNSHDQKNRAQRDAFVDEILKSVGYTVIHARGITETTLQPIAPQSNQP